MKIFIFICLYLIGTPKTYLVISIFSHHDYPKNVISMQNISIIITTNGKPPKTHTHTHTHTHTQRKIYQKKKNHTQQLSYEKISNWERCLQRKSIYPQTNY